MNDPEPRTGTFLWSLNPHPLLLSGPGSGGSGPDVQEVLATDERSLPVFLNSAVGVGMSVFVRTDPQFWTQTETDSCPGPGL